MRPSARFGILSGFIAVLWIVVVARAFQVQVIEHDHWESCAIQRQGDIRPLAANRGEIATSDGAILAETVSNRSLAVDPKISKDPEALAQALAAHGIVDEKVFLAQMKKQSDRRFVWVDRGLVDEAAVDELTAQFPELIAQTEAKRLYRRGEAASPLVGLVNREEEALGGLEVMFDQHLRGTGGKLVEVSDRYNDHFQGLETYVLEQPEPGGDLVLAIDSRMQEIAYAHLSEAMDQQEASSGFAVVTRPQTGEVLALVSLPSADPLDPSTWAAESLKMRAATDVFEPGSVYKIVPFSAALEAGRLSAAELIDCMDGEREVPGGRPIRDDHPCAVVPAWEVMAQSSNIGAGLIAERVGAEGFYRMERAFGFGLSSEVGLPGEGRGRIPEPSAWSLRSLVTMAFGQEVSCTGIQLAMSYGAIANEGLLMSPLLVRELRDASGNVMERREPAVVRRVLRPAVAAAMRTILRGVVTEGTGSAAEVEGYGVAGKTGTAQKYVKELGRYSKESYVASFVGFAPWDDPEVLCVVVLDEPRGDIYGGSVAAPVFRQILADVRPLLGGGEVLASITAPGPDPNGDSHRAVPEARGLTAPSARRVVLESELLPRFEGEGDRVLATRPPAGTRLLPGSVVTLEMDPAAEAGRMPDLAGLSLRDAWLRVDAVGAVPEVVGAGWVIAQSPKAGTLIRPGESCRIELSAKDCRAWKEFQAVEERFAGEFASGALLRESQTPRRVAGR